MKKEAFLKLHFSHALRELIGAGQTIDRLWQLEGHGERLSQLREMLSWCREHAHTSVQELSRHTHLVDQNLSQTHFLGILVPLERAHTRGVVDHDFYLEEGDDSSDVPSDKSPIYVVLDNMRSAFNVGAAFRSCECFGVQTLILCGYTATPENSKTKKTSMGTSDLVDWKHETSTLETIDKLKANGITVCAIEITSHSESLYETKLNFPVAFVFGNERHGLSPDIIERCDQVIHIPLNGRKNSLNVGVSLGVCLSESQRQLTKKDL